MVASLALAVPAQLVVPDSDDLQALDSASARGTMMIVSPPAAVKSSFDASVTWP
jgi:hypothetical protein